MSTTIADSTPQDNSSSAPPYRPIWKDAFFEYIGTFTFVYISLAGADQAILTHQLHIALCFLLGLSIGIILADKLGGHLNPAVTMTVYAATEGFKCMRLISYIVALLCGGFTAALLVVAAYHSWVNNNDNTDMVMVSKDSQIAHEVPKYQHDL